MNVGFNISTQVLPTSSVKNQTITKSMSSFVDTMKTIQNENEKNSAYFSGNIDFTNMTRKELSDWVDMKIKNGEITHEEAKPFRLMLIKVRVSDNYAYTLEEDSTRYNFIQRAQGGIGFAEGRSDFHTLDMLESAIKIMKQNQDKSVDIQNTYQVNLANNK
ncbi:hypothetical protein [Thorsellia anophelis]|uniref:Uncharacterized protein n=1 Tax=Thorsellia anophelis DSM 18579 TaxID=1123402 RepID=A0A1I0F8L2_9GAMM|nr:hypothetical protein [Thorsellia anophelis]SET54234.1 hypothetical protein SAMN02583745_02677 [Thorsellia anophelis DSM 18579]